MAVGAGVASAAADAIVILEFVTIGTGVIFGSFGIADNTATVKLLGVEMTISTGISHGGPGDSGGYLRGTGLRTNSAAGGDAGRGNAGYCAGLCAGLSARLCTGYCAGVSGPGSGD